MIVKNMLENVNLGHVEFLKINVYLTLAWTFLEMRFGHLPHLGQFFFWKNIKGILYNFSLNFKHLKYRATLWLSLKKRSCSLHVGIKSYHAE